MFLKSIDGTTAHFRSEGDTFRDIVRMQGTCPARRALARLKQRRRRTRRGDIDLHRISTGPA